jgi:hypothetical protein
VWLSVPAESRDPPLLCATVSRDCRDMAVTPTFQAVHHEVVRLSIDVKQPYEVFRKRYEEHVPFWPDVRISEMINGGAQWDEIVAAAEALSPVGLFNFWRRDTTQFMKLAGARWESTSYLIGTSVVAERLYLADPAVMSVVPFHVSISVGADGATRFTFNQPSTLLAGFDQPIFVATGKKVDARFAEMLGVLGVPIAFE